MKSLLLVSFAMSFVFPVAVKAQKADSTKEKEVYHTIVLIGEAWTKNNLDTLNKYIDANYIHTDTRGQKLDRALWLSYVKDRKDKGLTNPGVSFEKVVISIYGDVAIVTGINMFTGQAYTSNDSTGNGPKKLRFTQVLKKESGTWKRMVFQATYIDTP